MKEKMEIPHNTVIKKEFENLCFLAENVYGRNARCESALKKENVFKNRYRDVLPEEMTRVRLNLLNGEEHTDYINANYISSQFPNSNLKFISCQAPLESTFEDFYRCIWEQKCPLICMITRLIEGQKQKAHCYWPKIGETVQYGNFSVKVQSYQDLNNIEIRQLCISYDGEMRTITHILFSEWPDFGVPNSSVKILQLISELEKYEKLGKDMDLNGPSLIHCSAGIGRTGSLIAILFCLEKLRNGISPKELNIFDVVLSMRKQRAGMVQTVAQYEFVFSVLADIVESETFFLKNRLKRPTSSRRNTRKSAKLQSLEVSNTAIAAQN